MREMTHEEIMAFIRQWTWGTLIAVDGDKPYAVELSYGTDGRFIYCGSMPGGRMARCIKKNRQIAFKICDSDVTYSSWRAVIVEAEAELLTDYEDILYSVRMIARQRGFPENAFDDIAAKIAGKPETNSLRIPIKEVGGRISG